VVAWLTERRRSAEMHARRLAEAFELGNVETLSEATTNIDQPAQVTAHLVSEIERLLTEHT
jgi:hypothetical protein